MKSPISTQLILPISTKPFEIEFNVSRNDFLDWSSKKLKVELPFPPFSLPQFGGRKATSKKPLELGPPIDVSYSLKLTLPSKYQTRLPLPLKVSRDYGEYAANYKLEGQTLIGQRTLAFAATRIACRTFAGLPGVCGGSAF